MLFSFWYRKDTQFNKELTTIQWTPNNQQNGSFCAWDHDHQHPPWPGEQPRAWDHDHQGDGGGGRADHVSDQPGCPDGDFTTEWFNPRFSASYGAVYQREAGQAWTWPCPCMQVRHRLRTLIVGGAGALKCWRGWSSDWNVLFVSQPLSARSSSVTGFFLSFTLRRRQKKACKLKDILVSSDRGKV